jgi:hypothetical protein
VLGFEVASFGDEWKMNVSVIVTICAAEDLTRIAQACDLGEDIFRLYSSGLWHCVITIHLQDYAVS